MLDPSDLQHALEIVPVDRQTSRARSGSNHELIVLKLLTVLEDDLVLVELELSDGGVCSEIDVERSGGVLGGGSDCELLGVVHQGLENKRKGRGRKGGKSDADGFEI
jgi:hypothetical protein